MISVTACIAWIKQGGGEGQNRTVDTVIFSHVLYQLSYLARQDAEPPNYQLTGGLSSG
jgi:hypothetical protein